MRLRYFEYRKGRVEIIPMIDVMLFLLVFFIIVTLQMIPDAGVNLQLPQASQVQHLPHPKVTINLLADGTMQVKGQTLDAADLTTMLAADGNPAKTQVTIAADKHVAFQYFITAMDASRKAGVTDIGIAAQPTGPVAASPQSGQSGAGQGSAAPPSAGSAAAAAPTAASPAAAAPPSSAASGGRPAMQAAGSGSAAATEAPPSQVSGAKP